MEKQSNQLPPPAPPRVKWFKNLAVATGVPLDDILLMNKNHPVALDGKQIGFCLRTGVGEYSVQTYSDVNIRPLSIIEARANVVVDKEYSAYTNKTAI